MKYQTLKSNCLVRKMDSSETLFYTKSIACRCSVIKCYKKFHKVPSKTATMESLFSVLIGIQLGINNNLWNFAQILWIKLSTVWSWLIVYDLSIVCMFQKWAFSLIQLEYQFRNFGQKDICTLNCFTGNVYFKTFIDSLFIVPERVKRVLYW